MIQELLGAVVEERKLNNVPTSFLLDVSSGSPTTSSTTSSSPSQSAASSAAAATSENLRCPRCDSSNTKFCYYNNYNLTQPRHFCKTCRRYWTKGGALRNVPIGGGCRKTKAAAATALIGTTTKPSRPPAAPADAVLPSSPLLWASCSIPHSSHLLALLRASQAQQSRHLLNNSYCVKEEGDDAVGMSMMSLDPLANLCSSSSSSNNNNSSLLWRNESSQLGMQQYYYQQQQPQNLFLADTPTSSGIQELYQRLRAPPSYCGSSNDNVATATTTSTAAAAAAAAASIMEPIPLLSGPGDHQFGYWNPGLSWADLSTANGAFPLSYS